ncbi:hypothetical protein ACWGS9_34230 [Bradyrhizobium sp. Arg314]
MPSTAPNTQAQVAQPGPWTKYAPPPPPPGYRLVPVDGDPWANNAPADGEPSAASSGKGPRFQGIPVGPRFQGIPEPPPGFTLVPVDGDPFAPYGAPPPGVIIHGATSDYISDKPEISVARPSDDGGDRNTAIQDMALLKRAGSGLDSTRALAPTFQGVSFGGGDEAVSAADAAARAAMGGNFQNTYDIDQAAQKQVLARQRAEHPYLSTAGQVGGALLPGLGAAALTVKGAQALGGGIVPTLLANAGMGAGLGGVEGALSADPGNRLSGARTGAEWGGGLGLASVPLGSLAGRLVSAGANKVLNAIYSLGHGSDVPADAAKSIVTNLGRQGDTVGSALQTQADIGPGAVLADTGPATQGMTARLASRYPDVSPQMAQNLTERADQFGPRMNAAVDAAAGPDINAPQMMAQLKATTATNGAANYAKAFANQAKVDVTPVVAKIDSEMFPTTAAGTTPDPISAALQQARGYIAGPNFGNGGIEALHRAQDVIDDMANSAFRSGDNAKARALWDVRSRLLNQMDAANPDYAVARSQYASDKAVENAFENGRSIFAPKSNGQVYDPDLLESRLATMSPPEQQAFQLGTRKALTDTMGRARADAAGVKALLANEDGYPVQKLRQVIGDQQTQSLLDELDRQAQMQATNNLALQGSKTAMATAADTDIPVAQAIGGAAHGTSDLAGAYIGSKLGHLVGSYFGMPEVGEIAGLPLAYGVHRAVNAVNAGRESAASLARSGVANVLTSPMRQNVANALLAYERMAPISSKLSDGAKLVARAMLMNGSQNVPSLPVGALPR